MAPAAITTARIRVIVRCCCGRPEARSMVPPPGPPPGPTRAA
jgi:hypothetical protein